MTILTKSRTLLLALVMATSGGVASANRSAKPKPKTPAARKAKPKAKPATRRAKPKAKPALRRATRTAAATRRAKPKDNTRARSRARAKAKTPAKQPKTTTRFTIRNPGSLNWIYSPNATKDAVRKSYGLDPQGTSQTLLETELQATLDLSNYDSAIKAIQAIAKDPKKTAALLGNKKGWTLKVASKKAGTVRMKDFYADNPKTLALSRNGITARWRSVQRLDAKGKPLDDKQQLNVKAGFRMLANGVVVRVEAGNEVAGLVKKGRIADKRLEKFLTNHRLEDNPTNLIKQVLPRQNVLDLVKTPLVEVTQTRYKFHIHDASGAPVGEGSIDVVEAKPTPEARKFFGKQLKSSVRFGRVEYEGEHVNPTMSPTQIAQAQKSSGAHGAFDVYSNTLTKSSDIKTLTGIAGRLTKATGAKQAQGNKVFESMTRLGFFDHLPGGHKDILASQQKSEAKWLKQIKKANPAFID